MTPTPESIPSSSPYFFVKQEQFEVPYEDMCGLEDVRGVYIDDSPLFSHTHGSHFQNTHSMFAAQRY